MRVTSFAARVPILCMSFAAALALACGSNARPPELTDPFAAGRPDAGGPQGGSLEFDASVGPQSCDQGPSSGVCGCLDLTLLSDLPNLYFVLDRSGSMNEDDKWTTVRTVISGVATRLGPRARFAAALFPGSRGSCSPGEEVMPPLAGDPPGRAPGPTTDYLLSATNVPAQGGTPTSGTLRALAPRISALSGRTFVILATDGGPNCNATATCGVDECIPNIERQIPECPPQGPLNCCAPDLGGSLSCLDAQPLVNAVTELRMAGVPTYVLGVPGSAPYAALLDRVAQAGGTPRAESPRYYNVDSADADAFAAKLSQIAAKITATCVLPLKDVPDPARVNVYLDGRVVAKDPINGWILDETNVTLVGATCDRVLRGDALDLRVVAGCPTVTPK